MPDILAMLVSERNKLNRAIEALGGEIGSAVSRLTHPGKPARRSRFLSAESRARIAASQRARWAAVKAAPRRRGPIKMSAEAKAKISKAMKARWAARKKGA
jgi:hypothetical protein